MDIKPNSHTYKAKQAAAKQQEKNIVPVVSKAAVVKKKSGVNKLASIFISEDVSNVKDYIVQDIVVPTIKKGILGALDMILNGGSGMYSDRKSSSSRVSYRKYYDDPRDDRRRNDRAKNNTRFDYDDIIYETRGDAVAVLNQMLDTIDRYGMVTVSDMYEFSRLDAPYTSNNYGWFSLKGSRSVRAQGGYVLDLPHSEPIN